MNIYTLASLRVLLKVKKCSVMDVNWNEDISFIITNKFLLQSFVNEDLLENGRRCHNIYSHLRYAKILQAGTIAMETISPPEKHASHIFG